MVFSADETTDVGHDSGTAVASAYAVATSRFTGRIGSVQIDLGLDDHDHLINPDECLRTAMAQQCAATCAARPTLRGRRGSSCRDDASSTPFDEDHRTTERPQ